ncbi:hypothetical protein V3C41_00220 [Paenarthrobacter nicotinovorans]|uniref:Uncharacterized protein n=1 Tax=Paenarthrobacter nicotinovorans TaxID=29320 RepID=A0ABV0GM14_PAENI
MHETEDAEEAPSSTPWPEDKARLRRSFENSSEAVSPSLGRFSNGIELPPALATHQAMMNMIKPMLDAQAAARATALNPLYTARERWAKQLSNISSDIFRTREFAQPNLDSITARLTGNVDFGLSRAFAQKANQFAASQFSLLQRLSDTVENLKASFYPPNLRGIKGLRLEQVEQVVMVDGIALYSVPRPSIAEALIRADGASKRRQILGRRSREISDDCRVAVSGCSSDMVAPYVRNTLAALSALNDGHSEAAQALAASVLDAVVNSYFGSQRYNYTPNAKGNRTTASYDEFGAHEYIAFAPIWQAWQKFFPNEGRPVPYTFSRNATAHTVSTKQFTRRNAVQCLMIITGILVFIDEQLKELER